MAHDADDKFLARWSRRKHAVRRGETPPEPARTDSKLADAATPPPAPPAAAPTELPAVDSLKGLESDYQEFLRPDVDSATKSAALRKLFGDPHFNKMDGMDVYIDDYTKEDPIPTAMLRALNQARSLGLFDDEKKAEARAEPGAAESVPAAAESEPAAAEFEPAAAIEEAKPAPIVPAAFAQAEPQPADPVKPDPA